MTSLSLAVNREDILVATLRERMRHRLPEGCTLASGLHADILLLFNAGVFAPSTRTLWALAWADGTPAGSAQALAEAVSKPHAVMELILIQRNTEGWRELRRAAMSPLPGDFTASAERLCDYASILVAQALKGATISSSSPFFMLMPAQYAPVSYVQIMRMLWRKLRHKACQIAFAESWMIGRVGAPIESSPHWRSCPRVEWLGERSDTHYLADPFAWPGKPDRILCEEYDQNARLGHIVGLMIEGNRISRKVRVELPLSGHLSFPFLFAHEGEVYCLPESSEARKLMLLRWHDGAFTEFSTPLKNIAAADSVLFQYDGYFWITYTDVDIDPSGNLNLCFARSLEGPWQPHPGNPVKLDTRSARNAGTPFVSDGGLYRPAQDCSQTYGGAIRIMRIMECTPERFHEEEVNIILPEQGNPHGLHTLSACGGSCLIDGKRMVFSPRLMMRKARQRISRLIPGRH